MLLLIHGVEMGVIFDLVPIGDCFFYVRSLPIFVCASGMGFILLKNVVYVEDRHLYCS